MLKGLRFNKQLRFGLDFYSGSRFIKGCGQSRFGRNKFFGYDTEYTEYTESESDYMKFKGFRNTAMEMVDIPGVTIVRTKKQAESVLKILKSIPDRVHAWDTETIDIEVKEQSPVGNGNVISAQAFCGPDIDFGNGPRLFIDNFGMSHDNILLFKEYFEDKTYLKSWFNYGFDRHILYNHGINCQGFGGDSMHMARLVDPSRGPKAYSLSKLSEFYLKKINTMKREAISNLNSK